MKLNKLLLIEDIRQLTSNLPSLLFRNPEAYEKRIEEIDNLKIQLKFLDLFIFLSDCLNYNYEIKLLEKNSITITSKRKENFINNLIFGKINYQKVSLLIKDIIKKSKYKDLISFYNSNENFIFYLNDNKKIEILNKINEF